MGKLYDPQALGAECDVCPFNSETPVPPQEPKGHRDFTIVLEGPGGVEAVVGLPLSGKTGAWMEQVFTALGLDRKSLALRNAMACKPVPLASPGMFTAATRACHERLINELGRRGSTNHGGSLPETGREANGPLVDRRVATDSKSLRPGELILAMGNAAVKSLTGRSGIHDWRGYPLEGTSDATKDAIIFPTFHPSFVMREPWYWPVLKLDLQRALGFADGRFSVGAHKWPPLWVDDNAASLDALDRIYSAPSDVGVDVETGGKSPIKAPLLCVGIANSAESVSVKFPFPDRLDGIMRALLASKRHPKVLQNGSHDIISLQTNDVEISGNDYDLLPASRVAFPQIDHDLGFIASLLFLAPRWKSAYHAGKEKGDEAWLKAAKDENKFREMKIYNSKDAYMTVICKPRLQEMLRRLPHGEL